MNAGSQNPKRKPTAEEKKRKKQARKEIDAIFKVVKAGCDRLKNFEDVMKKVEKIKPTLARYADVLDPNLVKDITGILDKIDQTTQKGDQFCQLADRLKNLTGELYDPQIPRWVQDLTPAGLGGVVGGVVVALIVVSGLITTFSPFFSATIYVKNVGCEAIPALTGVPSLPGVSLWTGAINDGEEKQAKVPPFLQISVDARDAHQIILSVFNIPLPPLQPKGLKSVSLNEKEIINQVDAENIGVLATYHLVIACR